MTGGHAGPGLVLFEPASNAQHSSDTSHSVLDLLAAADDAAACYSTDAMSRRAVELARSAVGLERVGLYLRHPSRPRVVCGTWGTDLEGNTSDEHAFEHEFCQLDFERLRRLPSTGSRWLHFQDVPLHAEKTGWMQEITRGWLVVTPLLAAGELIGVMYNDSAISRTPISESSQIRAAAFCSLVAGQIALRDAISERPSEPAPAALSPMIRNVLEVVHASPHVSAGSLARQFAVSSPHLARSFKIEVGISFVEYRNHLRLRRFLDSIEQHDGNLMRAAMRAGFGSYSQLFRVFRATLGQNPREYLRARGVLVDETVDPLETDSRR